MFYPSMKAKMDGLEAKKAHFEVQLRGIPMVNSVTLHPGLADIYARKVTNLAESLNAEDTKAEAADILRGLIDKLPGRPAGSACHTAIRQRGAGLGVGGLWRPA